MSDAMGRVLVVGGVLLASVLVVLLLRRREAAPFFRISNTGLSPGIYFFSSSACIECGPVRARLIDELGEQGFEEFSWERDPGILEELGVEAVPATLLVSESGSGRLWPGDVESMFSVVDP